MLNYLSKTITMALLLGAFSAAADNTGKDSDGDGISDVIENRYGLDPHKAYDVWRDRDEDHLPDIQEYILGLDPQTKDNDVYNNRRLMAMGAVVDIHSQIPDRQHVDRLLKVSTNPVELYSRLLDEKRFSTMGFIGRVYQAILYRKPDLDGARYYYHMLHSGLSKLQMVAQFLGSKEFQQSYGELSDESFVDLAHLNIVGVSPQTEDLDFFLDLLQNQNLSRAQFILVLINSAEYVEAYDRQTRFDVLGLLLTGKVPSESQNLQYRQWQEEEGHIKSALYQLLSSDGFAQGRLAHNASLDSDDDGKVDGIEFADGTDIYGKDNDVLFDDKAFVAQMLRDIVGEYSLSTLQSQLSLLSEMQSRSRWLFKLMSDHGIGSVDDLAKNLLPQGTQRNNGAQTKANVQLIEALLQSETFAARFY